MKSKKTAFTKSLIALLLCVAMLIGTTFAWFTDSVTSGSNIIKSGKLDIEMYWTDDLDRGVWYNVEDPAYNTVFSYDKWEPGYTDVRYIKLVNKGNLALNYNLTLTPQNEVGKLAEVINVYFSNSEVELRQRSDLSNLRAIGLLNNVLNGGATAEGTLLASGQQSPLHPNGNEVIMTLAMSMINTAGNDYQNETSGDFTITALATQASFEKDSFDANYDTNAEYPSLLVGNSVSASVTPVDGKVPAGGVTMSKDGIAAYVPAGVVLEDGTDKLTLSVTPLANSNSGIATVNNEILIPVDVHIAGVSEENTVPIIIDLGEVLPKYLNMGNYHLFHVEDGNNVEMTLVESKASLTAHNQFTYEPLTGAISVAMASFSEVALVADTSSPWEGGEDYDWYTEEAKAAQYFEIANADQLYAFSKIVGGIAEGYDRDDFDGAIVKLLSDINLNHGNFTEDGIQKIFYPIGYYNNQSKSERGDNATGLNGVESTVYSFSGTFDGNGNQISNFYQNTWEMFGDYNSGYSGTPNYYKDAMGLFGYVNGGTVKNLTVDHFESDGEFTPTGVIAAYAANATFENIAITNCNPRVYNTGNGGIVGIGGNSDDGADKSLTFTNITVDNTNTISALWGSWDVACGGLMGMFRGNGTVDFTNCHVAAQIDVNNDVCANYQYYWYRYSGMFIGSVRKNTTEGGYTVADTTGITATECTYTLGKWNQYWYCELVTNSLASYTYDHQFSRLTTIESLAEIKDGEAWLKAGNFVLPATDNSSAECYHIFKDSEGNLYRHFHNVADASNPEIYEEFDVDGNGKLDDLKEDRTCYFMPFNQIMNGNGYGVKAHYTFPGITAREDGLDQSETKFESNGTTTYRPGQTITLSTLVNAIADESKISKATLFVAVSPATENDKVNATYTLDEGDWKNSTITFAEDCTGSAKVVITDYFYCTPTVIYLNPEQAAEKFTANALNAQDAYTQITLGDLFVEKATIGDVTATVTDPDGNETTVTGTNSDWKNQTINLTNDGTWTVAIKDDDAYCAVTSAEFTVNKVDKFTKKFDKDFLYRVGNVNTVALNSLFGDLSEAIAPVGVNVTVTTDEGVAAGTYTTAATWTDGKIKFTGTGVVTVTISADGANELSLKLEVVDAKNITTATSATANNVVLLNNTSGSFSVSGNYTFYGNGFTVTLPTSSVTNKGNGFCGHVNLSNGHLDNVNIVGPVYPEQYIYRTQAEITNSSDPNYGDGSNMRYFYNSVIVNSGDCNITNSCISGSRTAIYIKDGGDVLIENTTVTGGAYANIEVAVADSVTFKNLTTEQIEVEDSYNAEGSKKKMIGLGIVIDNAETEVYIEETLNQYNWITQAQWEGLLGDYAKQFPELFTDTTYQDYWHYRENDNTTKYVNLTMIFACDWDSNKLHDNRSDKAGYTQTDVTVATASGGVYVPGNLGTLTDALFCAPEYAPSAHFAVSPKAEFDYTTKNYVASTEGSNEFCYEDGGIVKISFDEGNNKVWDTSILTVTKGNQTILYTVSMDGVDYTGESITFTETGNYTVTYTYSDPYNYKLNSQGEIDSYSKEYQKTVNISVAAVAEAAKNATFTMGSAGQAVDKITINNNVYLSASGLDNSSWTSGTGLKFPQSDGDNSTIPFKYSGNENGSWASATINGQTFYFPVVAMGTTDGKWSHTSSWYGCFPVFEGAITITDYADGGTGAETVYDSSTTTMPTNLAALYPQTVFRYQGTQASVPTTPSKMTKGTYNGKLCYTTQTDLGYSNARSEEWNLATYTYTDNKGTTYYWYVAYYCAESTKGCVTPDTLITLADGSKQEIQDVRVGDMVKAWNFYTGKYEIVPVTLLQAHSTGVQNVLHLYFEDGTELKVLGEHGVFDADLNTFVFVDESDVSDYVGHNFVKQDGDAFTTVKLIDYEVTTEYTTAYTILSYAHYNVMAEDMFTVTPAHIGGNFFNPFCVNDDMMYDEAEIQKDIEKYGLYTYEDFDHVLTYEQFVDLNLAHFKVSVGKGYITYDGLIYLIENFVNNEDFNVH